MPHFCRIMILIMIFGSYQNFCIFFICGIFNRKPRMNRLIIFFLFLCWTKRTNQNMCLRRWSQCMKIHKFQVFLVFVRMKTTWNCGLLIMMRKLDNFMMTIWFIFFFWIIIWKEAWRIFVWLWRLIFHFSVFF